MTSPSATASPDSERQWLDVLGRIVDLGAHELKDVLNGVSLNLEVVRSRSSSAAGGESAAITPFAIAAASQLELVGERVEALLFLARPPRTSADVGLALRHLGALLVPAARAEGGQLTVSGAGQSLPSTAPAHAVRLALGGAMLELVRLGGSGSCTVEPPSGGSGTVVRFSHESARGLTLAPALQAAIAQQGIMTERSGSDLLVAFPGT